METIIKTFLTQKSELWQALLQHLSMSLISLILAILIAIPLAIYSEHKPRLANGLLQVTGILQTIPSLALLGLLIPIVGIGTIPAIIALVIYALLPIFQNTYVGLKNVDNNLIEAADAFGMTRFQKLIKVEIPIALPTIIAGIRTALVLIIGTATIAALIGAGGLGNFILLGINRNDMSLILIGAISSALLALILSGLLTILSKFSMKRIITILGICLAVIISAGFYGSFNQPAKSITIAGKLGSEPDILINMYKDLIENDNKNVKVTLKPNFGETSFLFNALKSDKIDIYPEFTGTVLENLVKNAPKETLNQEQTYSMGKKLVSKQFQMDYLSPMQYENTYAIVVKKAFAEKYNLKTISDLKKVEPQLKGGMTLEFLNRPDGWQNIKKTYHIDIPIKSMQASLRYEALNNGQINVADAYSTDSQIKQFNLVVLKDDQHVFPNYQGAPLMKEAFAKKNPKIVKSLDKLAHQISAEDMQKMNYEVNVEKIPAKQVAFNYLKQHDLVEKR